MKLVMTLRTHDQADIVDAVVAFHLNAGVDFVIATDHRSQDGTVEILEEYERAGVLHLIREHGAEVRGSEWRTRMARMAATDYGADWTFSCDGDEFWWPRGADLKEVFTATPDAFGVVYGLVRPFVPVNGVQDEFAERMTVRFSPAAPLNDPTSPFRPYSKVAHRGDPTVVVHRGNHELHATRLALLSRWYPIEILHFPIRTEAQAEAKYLAWWRALGETAPWTHRRVALLETTGRLDEHYGAFVIDDETIAKGVAAGTLVVDTRLRDVLRALSRSGAPSRGFALPSELKEPLALLTSERDGLGFANECVLGGEANGARLLRRIDVLERRVIAVEHRR